MSTTRESSGKAATASRLRRNNMEITYAFEMDVETQKETSPTDLSPDFEIQSKEVEYTYSVEPSEKDVADYYAPYLCARHDREIILSTIEKMWDYLDLDRLEEDEDFMDFMKDRYESEAYEECEREYEN